MIRRARVLRADGFSYVELMMTLAIMGILAMVALAAAQADLRRRQEHQLRLALQEIRSALDAYKRAGDEGRIARAPGASGYPPSLMQLVQGVPAQQDVKSGEQRERLYFLRRIPADPLQTDPALRDQPERTWGLRSYASSADAPAPGEDVFDVYSLSERTGGNGIPYRQW